MSTTSTRKTQTVKGGDTITTYKELLHAIVPHITELGYEYDRVSQDGKDALDAIYAIYALANGEEK